RRLTRGWTERRRPHNLQTSKYTYPIFTFYNDGLIFRPAWANFASTDTDLAWITRMGQTAL
ncbi:MAG TPA: hypothetical protein V6C46_05415, partial [Coleofasciculaceae cyanobacterium]